MGLRDAELMLKTIGGGEKSRPTYVDAVVSTVKGKTAYVDIEGGAKRTPCLLAMSAKEGDRVQVMINQHVASVVGNYTDPATSDEEAKKARSIADQAFESLQDAYNAAQSAEAAADTANQAAISARADAATANANAEAAVTAANTATTAADTATQKADEAIGSASTANIAATRALNNLSDVEKVVDALNWISEHGTWHLAEETVPIEGRVYHTRTGSGTSADPYQYHIVNEVPPSYSLTQDVAIDPNKTYYTRNGSGTEFDPYVYTPVENPVVEDIGTYYEQHPGNPHALGYYWPEVDESIRNYIRNHASLDDDGLWLTAENNTSRVLISTGTEIYDPGMYVFVNNAVVASYGENAIIGDSRGANITVGSKEVYSKTTDTTINPNKTYYELVNDEYVVVANPDVSDISDYYEIVSTPWIALRQMEREVAWITNNELHIPNTVVLNSMQIGNWAWEAKNNGNLRLSWVGGSV